MYVWFQKSLLEMDALFNTNSDAHSGSCAEAFAVFFEKMSIPYLSRMNLGVGSCMGSKERPEGI